MADKKTILIGVRAILDDLFPAVTPEYKFHPSRKWRADFAIPHLYILIEIEGGVYTKGRHTRGKGYTNDCEKYNAAGLLGYTVYRFTYEHLRNGYFTDFIKQLSDTINADN